MVSPQLIQIIGSLASPSPQHQSNPLFLLMDSSEFSGGSGRPSPRRELQGPRPAPLKVHKDSYKVKKPPLAPPQRPPVIIYTVSPKVIHTHPSEFMSLVQRLTGPSSSSSSSSSFLPPPSSRGGSLPIPHAVRPAAAENTRDVADGDHRPLLDQPGSIRAGILSPMPTSLPHISPSFFSPPVVDTNNSLNFFHELSPYYGNRSYVDNTFLVSPSNLLATPMFPSPSPSGYWDLFNQYQDL